MTGQPGGRVVLTGGRSASEIFHAALADALARTGDDPAPFGLPANPDAFRSAYPLVLPRFECARRAGTRRHDMAGHAVAALQRLLVWQADGAETPLESVLPAGSPSLPLHRHDFTAPGGWRPEFAWRGRSWTAAELAVLGEELASSLVITPAAARALAWVQTHLVEAGAIDLRGRRIAMLGAGAEMAPTRWWLQAGADVLWLDTAPPPAAWRQPGEFSGRLFWPEQPVDLLTRPQDVLGLLRAFTGEGPVDLGLYAYAPGQAREMRLTGVMNALVDALPAASIRSVTLLVSPTTPTALDRYDLDAMATRFRTRPGWESLLGGLGLLPGDGGSERCGDIAVSRTVVGIQGASYQAAQYIGKILAAERWACGDGVAGPAGFRVSANTAAITRTRSLEHPVFAAAFGGAAAFGVETLTPPQSQQLGGLLALHDWLHPQPPLPGAIRVHGGVHTLPYALEPALRVAAAIGFMRSPRLLGGLFRR